MLRQQFSILHLTAPLFIVLLDNKLYSEGSYKFVLLDKVILMARYICLRCHNRWTSRSERTRILRCTNLECHSRQVCKLSELEKVVLEVKGFLDTVGRPLQGPTVFEALVAVRRLRLKIGLPLLDSLNLFKWIYNIASSYRPEQENLEDALERVER